MSAARALATALGLGALAALTPMREPRAFAAEGIEQRARETAVSLLIEDERSPTRALVEIAPFSWARPARIVVAPGAPGEPRYVVALRRVDRAGRVFVEFDVTRVADDEELRLATERDLLASTAPVDAARLAALDARLRKRLAWRAEVTRGARTPLARGAWPDGTRFALWLDAR